MQKAYSGRLYFSKYNYLEFFKHPLVFISGYPAKTENVSVASMIFHLSRYI